MRDPRSSQAQLDWCIEPESTLSVLAPVVNAAKRLNKNVFGRYQAGIDCRSSGYWLSVQILDYRYACYPDCRSGRFSECQR